MPFLISPVIKEKPALLFFLKLLILLCLLKSGFLFYNYRITSGWGIVGLSNFLKLAGWSLLYDLFCICCINLPFFILLQLLRQLPSSKLRILFFSTLFALLNCFCILLNTIDIFYFRFHQQRADADLLYVLKDPFQDVNTSLIMIAAGVILYFLFSAILVFKWLKKAATQYQPGHIYLFTLLLPIAFMLIFSLTGANKLLPSFPLSTVSSKQLPLTQNSLHTFVYSIYRRNESKLHPADYMSEATRHSLFSINKKNTVNPSGRQRNIVLFIMESIPEDFFNPASKYKAAMPFFDSLVNSSTYFSNAFSYAHNSNKGIMAILAGMPTITEIPLYHSNFTSLPVTQIGNRLLKNNYGAASFFIGDHYDDFGFAKCCNWLGLKYYSMENIAGYQQMEKHPMGLQDGDVLPFMANTINQMKQPFLAINFNISTHYSNDLPKNYKEKNAGKNFSAEMKSMEYYDDCLAKFFTDAATNSWYKNTVFIFCSDHWGFPDGRNPALDIVQEFRIPMLIHDPANNQKKIDDRMVSQFDIVNTILHYSNDTAAFISYGNNLADGQSKQGIVFCKENNLLYQAIDSNYILGFNALSGKPEYCYQYKKDPLKKNNLIGITWPAEVDALILQMKAFLQTTTLHYKNGKP